MIEFDSFLMQLTVEPPLRPRIVAAHGDRQLVLDPASFARHDQMEFMMNTPQQVIRAIYEVLRVRAVANSKFFEVGSTMLVRYQPREDLISSELRGVSLVVSVLGRRMWEIEFPSEKEAMDEFLHFKRMESAVKRRAFTQS